MDPASETLTRCLPGVSMLFTPAAAAHSANITVCARLRGRRIAFQSLYDLSGVSSNVKDIGSVRREGWR